MKKKLLFSIVLFIFTMLFSHAYAEEITITMNGTKIESDSPALIVDDRTLVPLRAVSNALNCSVAWDGERRGVVLYSANPTTYEEKLVFCWIDKSFAFKLKDNALDSAYEMDVAPMIINDRTYVPIRVLSELFGVDVDWNGETQTVIISADLQENVATDEDAEFLVPIEYALSHEYDTYVSFLCGSSEIINAEIELKNGGVIALELYPTLAPETVANFVKLANENFYDGLIFHRVIPGFMIQGGGMDSDKNIKPAENIHGEFLTNGYVNLIPHKKGVISMARTMTSNDSASSQFFIMHEDYPSLNGMYAAFGAVRSGFEYVDEIAALETDENDCPVANCAIKSIRIQNN